MTMFHSCNTHSIVDFDLSFTAIHTAHPTVAHPVRCWRFGY